MKKFNEIIARLSYYFLGDKNTYRLMYFHQRGHWPNFKDPKDLSERLLSAMLNPSFQNYAEYVDKVKSRNFVKSKGLGHLLINHFGIWDKPEDIDFDSLPNKFVLKANNGCDNHVFCKDKTKLNKSDAIKTLNLSIEEGKNSREIQYRAIVPKIFCEELLDTGTEECVTDYKVTCINGKANHFFVATERSAGVKYCTMDLDWFLLPYTRPRYAPSYLPNKPQHIEKMIEYAEILSKGFEFVRVDFYEFEGSIYFGELTFSPWGGLMHSYNNESLVILGQLF